MTKRPRARAAKPAQSQLEYTWRSAIGVDRKGDLLYVAADKIMLSEIAHALVQAGAVRGMQLDIHPGMVTFNLFQPNTTAANSFRA